MYSVYGILICAAGQDSLVWRLARRHRPQPEFARGRSHAQVLDSTVAERYDRRNRNRIEKRQGNGKSTHSRPGTRRSGGRSAHRCSFARTASAWLFAGQGLQARDGRSADAAHAGRGVRRHRRHRTVRERRRSTSVPAGEALFVPAGVEHRFEDFTPDFATWVFFYGPEGGEAAAG